MKKKVLACMLIICMTVSAVACGSSSSSTNADSEDTDNEEVDIDSVTEEEIDSAIEALDEATEEYLDEVEEILADENEASEEDEEVEEEISLSDLVDVVIADGYMDAFGSVFVSCTITNNADAAVDVVPIFYAEEYYLDGYGDYVLADNLFDMCTEYSWGFNTYWDDDEFLVISNAPDYIEPGETRTVEYALTADAYRSGSDYNTSQEPYLENFTVDLLAVSYSSEGASSHPANLGTDVLLELEYAPDEEPETYIISYNGQDAELTVLESSYFDLTGSVTNLTDYYLSEISILVIVNNLSGSEDEGNILATYSITLNSLKPGESVEISERKNAIGQYVSEEYKSSFRDNNEFDVTDYSSLNYELGYFVDYVIDAEKMESLSE